MRPALLVDEVGALVADDDEVEPDAGRGPRRTTRWAGAKSVFATSFVRSTRAHVQSDGPAARAVRGRGAVSAPERAALNVPANVPSALTATWATALPASESETVSPATAGVTVPRKCTRLP